MIIRTLLAVVLVLVILGALYVRLAPVGPDAWHVDASDAARTGKPNDYLVAEGGDRGPVDVAEDPATLLARLDAVAMAEPRVTRLAGDPQTGRVTYVQRSRIMGYPDVISVTATPTPDGSRLSIYSRARFGQSDLGVNKARVERWLAKLDLG